MLSRRTRLGSRVAGGARAACTLWGAAELRRRNGGPAGNCTRSRGSRETGFPARPLRSGRITGAAAYELTTRDFREQCPGFGHRFFESHGGTPLLRVSELPTHGFSCLARGDLLGLPPLRHQRSA